MSDGSMFYRERPFFGMLKYPQIGDHIIDLTFERATYAEITDIRVLMNGHAIVEVKYVDPSTPKTTFNFVNHGSTWRLLEPAS